MMSRTDDGVFELGIAAPPVTLARSVCDVIVASPIVPVVVIVPPVTPLLVAIDVTVPVPDTVCHAGFAAAPPLVRT